MKAFLYKSPQQQNSDVARTEKGTIEGKENARVQPSSRTVNMKL